MNTAWNIGNLETIGELWSKTNDQTADWHVPENILSAGAEVAGIQKNISATKVTAAYVGFISINPFQKSRGLFDAWSAIVNLSARDSTPSTLLLGSTRNNVLLNDCNTSGIAARTDGRQWDNASSGFCVITCDTDCRLIPGAAELDSSAGILRNSHASLVMKRQTWSRKSIGKEHYKVVSRFATPFLTWRDECQATETGM